MTTGMSSFGPAPIPSSVPGAVVSSYVGQAAQAPRARDKQKPQESTPFRQVVRDEVRLSDPQAAEAVDPKPDAAEEWKHRRKGAPRREPRSDDAIADPADGGAGHLDISA
jgi:hypothetical protein